jgi:hypothetical protein
MSESIYLTEDELPPRPDPKTGFPRPPHAPRWFEQDDKAMKADKDREQSPPKPPYGQGSPLVWYRKTRRASFRTSAIVASALVALHCVGNGTHWLTEPRYWGVWAVFGAFLIGIYVYERNGRFSAGADWLARGGTWVRVYELVEITTCVWPYSDRVRLRDQYGRTVRYKIENLRCDRLLWDLAYNGILHSVIARDAEIDEPARQMLDMNAYRPVRPRRSEYN